MVQYSPLDPQKSEIRLVTLLPGKSRDAIRCTLSIASLDSLPEFTALSYVWGNPSKKKPIIVDSEPFDVTVNLEACLRAIRKRWRRCVLWIDAICINQTDVQEKNVQVPQMGRLYSIAPVVLVWLGPSNTNIKLFVSWMRAHTAKSYNTASAYWLMLGARAALSGSAKRQRDLAVVRAREGYLDFLALPYWGRAWTFQEYLLPRNAPMLLCGDIQPFQLSTVIEKLNIDTLIELDLRAMKRLYARYDNLNSEGVATLAEIHVNRLEKMQSTSVNAVSSLPELRNNHDQTLSDLLFHTANRQCFDERDKIFALYGMLPAAQDVHPPDYTKPITEVMLQAVAYVVNFEHQGYRLWRSFGLRDERLSDASHLYPSWMPDFTQTAIKAGSLGDMNRHRGGEVAIPLTQLVTKSARVSVEHSTLRLWARCLGTCKVAIQFADAESIIFEQIEGLLQTDGLEAITGKPVKKPGTLISRIARTCVAHYASSYDFSTNEIVEAFYLVFKSDSDSLDGPVGSCLSLILTAAGALSGKVFLTTEDGCFGISVGGAKDGDIVIVPPEVAVPLVLRPEPSTLGDKNQYYKMVGTAIIDGVVREGELFDEELVEEIARRDVVEFLIH